VAETEAMAEPAVTLAAESAAIAIGPAPAIASEPMTFVQKTRKLIRRRRWPIFWIGGGLGCALAYLINYLSAGAHLDPKLSITGVVIGVLIGLTGMGGGALMTPILVLLFGYPPTLAVGTDVTYSAITKVFGGWRHLSRRNVDLRIVMYLALGSVPSTIIGVGVINYIKHHYGDTVNTIMFRSIGGALVVVSVALVIKTLVKIDREHSAENIPLSSLRKAMTVLLGATTGFVVGLTSVGSGTFLGLFLLLCYPMLARRIVGTDVFHAAILLGATSLAQLSIGNVKGWAVASLLLGSIPGVVIGSHTTARTPERLLKICLASVLFFSGLALLNKSGINLLHVLHL
jgi:uncharacterized membrane protein YfcA